MEISQITASAEPVPPTKRQTIAGIAVSIVAFLALRLIDIALFKTNVFLPMEYTLIGTQTRVSMILCAAIAIGSYVSRGRSLTPMIFVVLATWIGSNLHALMYSDQSANGLRIGDLDWLGTFLAMLVTIIGAKIGLWVRKMVDQEAHSLSK